MTVKELIEILSKFPPETEVMESGTWCGELDGKQECSKPYLNSEGELHIGA